MGLNISIIIIEQKDNENIDLLLTKMKFNHFFIENNKSFLSDTLTVDSKGNKVISSFFYLNRNKNHLFILNDKSIFGENGIYEYVKKMGIKNKIMYFEHHSSSDNNIFYYFGSSQVRRNIEWISEDIVCVDLGEKIKEEEGLDFPYCDIFDLMKKFGLDFYMLIQEKKLTKINILSEIFDCRQSV